MFLILRENGAIYSRETNSVSERYFRRAVWLREQVYNGRYLTHLVLLPLVCANDGHLKGNFKFNVKVVRLEVDQTLKMESEDSKPQLLQNSLRTIY
jgi:hypothetical protein